MTTWTNISGGSAISQSLADQAATSATDAANSATAAATSATNSATSATASATSATASATSATASAASASSAAADLATFQGQYHGASATAPTTGLDTGDLYFDTVANAMKVYDGSSWVAAYISAAGVLTAANNLSDVSSASASRTNLGLGTMATQAANSVAITGGSISGITDLAVADGGTGASTASVARTNLGLVIGTDVQAYDAGLSDIAGLAVTDGNFVVGDGANWVAESGATARTSLGLGTLAVENTSAVPAMTYAGTQSLADNIVDQPKLQDYSETVNAIGSTGGGTQDIDLELGNVITATVDTSANTFTFSNPPASGSAGSFTLILTNGGSQTVNWPASVDWAGGTSPTLTAAGVDVLTFVTTDGGTTYYGFLAGADMK